MRIMSRRKVDHCHSERKAKNPVSSRCVAGSFAALRMTIFTVGLCVTAGATFADGPSVGWWSEILTQARGAQNGRRELPVNFLHQGNIRPLGKDGRLDLYGQFTREFGPDTNDYHLYTFSLDLPRLAPHLGLNIGRRMIVRGTQTALTDGAAVRATFGDGAWFFDGHGGLTHSVEMGDFFARPGLITGTQIGWRPNADTQMSLGTTYRRDDFRRGAWRTGNTQLVDFGFHQQFGAGRTIHLYGETTYDVAGKTFTVGTLGGYWHPHPQWVVTVAGSRYDADRNRTRRTILSLFADDDLWQARVGIRFLPSAGIGLSVNYDWQQLETGGVSQTGHVADAGVEFDVRKIRTDGGLRYHLTDSYGGRAHDLLFHLRHTLPKFIALDCFTNYTNYIKMTNDNDNALATGLGATATPTDLVALRVGGEFLRNNHFSTEWRVTGSLTIDWDGAK